MLGPKCKRHCSPPLPAVHSHTPDIHPNSPFLTGHLRIEGKQLQSQRCSAELCSAGCRQMRFVSPVLDQVLQQHPLCVSSQRKEHTSVAAVGAQSAALGGTDRQHGTAAKCCRSSTQLDACCSLKCNTCSRSIISLAPCTKHIEGPGRARVKG